MLARKLRPGDTLGIIAPSSPVTPETEAQFESGIALLEGLGFETVLGEHLRSATLGYCAAPEEKVADITAMVTDPSVAGLICAHGGATVNACLPLLPWELLAGHPKVVLGMSDNTVLVNAIYARVGLVTFHGPDLVWSFGRGASTYDREAFTGALMEGRLGAVPPAGERRTVRPGSCEGTAIGGNLRCLLKLAGTSYFPDPAGAVLFLETAGLSPETCEYMLWQLREMDVFEWIVGAVVGHIDGWPAEPESPRFEDLLLRIAADYDFPILKVEDFGHNCANAVLPIGGLVRIDASKQTLAYAAPYLT